MALKVCCVRNGRGLSLRVFRFAWAEEHRKQEARPHTPFASLDGRLDIAADGTVTTQIVGENRLATRLSGTRVDDIKTAVKDTLWH